MDVVIGAQSGDAFAADCLGARSTKADRARLLDLMEAQRWRLGMFASCGWFWDDPSGPRRRRSCAPRRVPCASWTASRDPDSSSASSRISPTIQSPSTGIDGAAIYRQALIEVGQPPPGDGHAKINGDDGD